MASAADGSSVEVRESRRDGDAAAAILAHLRRMCGGLLRASIEKTNATIKIISTFFFTKSGGARGRVGSLRAVPIAFTGCIALWGPTPILSSPLLDAPVDLRLSAWGIGPGREKGLRSKQAARTAADGPTQRPHRYERPDGAPVTLRDRG